MCAAVVVCGVPCCACCAVLCCVELPSACFSRLLPHAHISFRSPGTYPRRSSKARLAQLVRLPLYLTEEEEEASTQAKPCPPPDPTTTSTSSGAADNAPPTPKEGSGGNEGQEKEEEEEGADALLAPPSAGVRRLLLTGNRLGDAGARALASSLKKDRSLEVLDLSRCCCRRRRRDERC